MIRVGLIGYGKAGQAVARVLEDSPGIALQWIARRNPARVSQAANREGGEGGHRCPVVALEPGTVDALIPAYPVDALVDFSSTCALPLYGEAVRAHQLMLVSAISAYAPCDIAYLANLGRTARVMSSPNITLGINFLILAARLLRGVAPFADIEIIEQHFREKPEMSGTARKIAESLHVENDRITSLRLGGIVGQHEVIFGFPHQTVRLTHDSIRREAFGTGAVFALEALALCPPGHYSFDDLLLQKVRQDLHNI
jgi:4-hydroxy-tetrahydrodipicolinate reductase